MKIVDNNRIVFLIQGCAVANISSAAFAVLFSVGTIAAVCRLVKKKYSIVILLLM